MPRIPTHQRQVMPSGRIGAAPMPTDIARTGEGAIGAGLQRLGGGIQNISRLLAAADLRLQQIEGNSQFDTARKNARQMMNAGFFAQQDNTEPTTHQGNYDKIFKDVEQLIPENQFGARKFQSWLEGQAPTWDAKFNTIYRQRIGLNAEAEYFKNLGGVSAYENREEANLEAGTLTKGAVADGVRTPKEAQDDYAKAMHSWDTQDLFKRAVILDLSAGTKLIKSAKFLTVDEKQRLVDDLKFTKAGEMEALELKQEAERDALGKALNAGTITYKDIDDSSLDEKEQETYRIRMNTEAERRAKGKPIVSTKSIQSQLFEMATDLDVLDVSFKNYQDILNNARFGKIVKGKAVYAFKDTKSDVPLIDDTDYEELSDKAIMEIAGMLKSAHTRAKELIVTHPDDRAMADFLDARTKGMKPSVADLFRKTANEERQYQFALVQKYEREVELWYAANKDKSGKEIYQYLESKKWEYFNISKDGLDRMKEEVARPIEIEEPPTAIELRRQNTKEAYELGRKYGYWK